MEINDDEPEREVTTLQKMALEFTKLTSMERPHTDACKHKTLMKHLMAVAQASHDAQTQSLEGTLQYVTAMHRAGLFRAVVLAFSTHFDESPLKLRVAFSNHGGQCEEDRQLGKIVVVRNSWVALVQDMRGFEDEHQQDPHAHPRFILLHGERSPQIRACDRATGEGLGAVLLSCTPWKQDLTEVFPMRVSVFEADSNGANDRAIDLSRCKAPGNALLHLRCLCHRVHTSAKKTFELRPDVLSGLTRCLLVLGQSTAQCLCVRPRLAILISGAGCKIGGGNLACRRLKRLLGIGLRSSLNKTPFSFALPAPEAPSIPNHDNPKSLVCDCAGVVNTLGEFASPLRIAIGSLEFVKKLTLGRAEIFIRALKGLRFCVGDNLGVGQRLAKLMSNQITEARCLCGLSTMPV